MVVVAVRDAGTGARAARLGLRVLLAAGFGFVAWVVGALLFGSTASAEDAHSTTTLPPRDSLSTPKLVTGLTTVLTGLVGTVDQVTAKVSQVSQVTQVVTEPVQTAVELAGSTPVGPLLSLKPHPGPLDPVKSEPRSVPAPTPIELQAPAAPPVDAAPAKVPADFAAHPVKLRRVTPVPFTQRVDRPDAGGHARQTDPSPPPMRNDGQTVGVAATHDGGGAGKHPFVVLGSALARADLRPGAVAAVRPVRHEGRDAALPATSPD